MGKEITTYEESTKVIKENFVKDGKRIEESYPAGMQAYFIGATDGDMDTFSIMGGLRDFADLLCKAICLHVSDDNRSIFMDYLCTQIDAYEKGKDLEPDREEEADE